MPAFSAKIERVDIVEAAAGADSVVDKGLNILKARVSQFGGGQHAEYTILVVNDGETYTIRKRFSEFAELHAALKARYTSLSFDLPAKTPIRFFNPDKLDDRKNSLNAYLKELCSRTDLCNSTEVQRFLSSTGAVTNTGPERPVLPSGGNNASDSFPAPNNAPPRPYQTPNQSKVSGPRHDDEDDLIGWDN